MVLYINENYINEAVSGPEVIDALNKRRGIIITYTDEKASHPGRRYIEPYVYGLTSKGNPCLRAYQYYGDTKKGVPRWKLFRLDRIQSWEPTENVFDLEPQARGWAAEAYNNNGDGSMSTVYKTVELAPEPETEYEKLKAKTRSLQNSKPLNINQFKDRLQYPEERNKPQTDVSKSGPIGNNEPQQQAPEPIQPTKTNNISKPLQNNGEVSTNNQSPIQEPPQVAGPLSSNSPQIQNKEDVMSNDEFQKMLRRNLEITNQEKERRKQKKLQNLS